MMIISSARLKICHLMSRDFAVLKLIYRSLVSICIPKTNAVADGPGDIDLFRVLVFRDSICKPANLSLSRPK